MQYFLKKRFKLMRLIVVIFCYWVISGCFLFIINSVIPSVISGQDRLIARAENHYLYLSDIERNFKTFASVEDSILIIVR